MKTHFLWALPICALAGAALTSCALWDSDSYYISDSYGYNADGYLYDSLGYPIFGYIGGRPVYGYRQDGYPLFDVRRIGPTSSIPHWGPAPYCKDRSKYKVPAQTHRIKLPPPPAKKHRFDQGKPSVYNPPKYKTGHRQFRPQTEGSNNHAAKTSGWNRHISYSSTHNSRTPGFNQAFNRDSYDHNRSQSHTDQRNSGSAFNNASQGHIPSRAQDNNAPSLDQSTALVRDFSRGSRGRSAESPRMGREERQHRSFERSSEDSAQDRPYRPSWGRAHARESENSSRMNRQELPSGSGRSHVSSPSPSPESSSALTPSPASAPESSPPPPPAPIPVPPAPEPSPTSAE